VPLKVQRLELTVPAEAVLALMLQRTLAGRFATRCTVQNRDGAGWAGGWWTPSDCLLPKSRGNFKFALRTGGRSDALYR
jgi:hypothetical protein